SDLPAFRLQEGLPFPYVQPLGAAIGPSAFLSQAVTYDEPNGRTPYSQQFTFTLQHQLPGGYLLETSYSGNKGTKLRAGTYDVNQLDPQNLSLGSALLNPVPNPYQGRRSEEHTSELQSRFDLVCRLLLEKKKNTQHNLVYH